MTSIRIVLFLIVFGFATSLVQAQPDKLPIRRSVNVLLEPSEILIHDIRDTIPLKVGFTFRGTVRNEQGQIIPQVKIKLIDVTTQKVAQTLSNSSKAGKSCYQSIIKKPGTYFLHFQKKGYRFHSQYIRVDWQNDGKTKVLDVVLKSLKQR